LDRPCGGVADDFFDAASWVLSEVEGLVVAGSAGAETRKGVLHVFDAVVLGVCGASMAPHWIDGV
jgi:hypothetical protein